ncbi:MAG: T9SS type A sorting domain-containing protein [Spirosomataceae bacterium]
MKKNILIYVFLTCFCFQGLSDALAQSEASRSKSRLNIGKKPVESTATSPTFSKIPSSLDRSIKLRPSSAINAYYRSILLNPTTGNSSVGVINKNRTNKETSAVAATETRPGLEDAAKSEDLLFVSDKLRVLNAYPNPANEYTEIDYQLSPGVGTAKIALFNVIGNSVAEYDLDKNDRQLRIPTREMPTGVYFYRLLLEGKAIATKKLLIRH